MNGSWAKPLEIGTVPYLSKGYTNYVEDYSPVPCMYERNRVRVFRCAGTFHADSMLQVYALRARISTAVRA